MTTRSMAFVGTWILMAAITGCGSSVTTGGGGTGGTGNTGGNGGNGGSSVTTGGGAACGGFENETAIGSVTVHIRNQTPVTIYVPADCEGRPVYTLATAGGGEDATSYPFDASCLQTCIDLQKEGQYACGACEPTVIRIEAGQTRDVVWDGTGLRGGYPMPAQCWKEPTGNTTCSRIVAAPAGMWVVGATAYNGCTDGCMCTPDGSCFGGTSGQTAYADMAQLSFPDQKEVDVVFDSCAFGCP